MNRKDLDTRLSGMDVPDPGRPPHQQDLKIPLLSYRRSARAGWVLLALPGVVALLSLLKHSFGMLSPVQDGVGRILAGIEGHPVLTYLIPVLFVGLPFVTLVINLLAICHVACVRDRGELQVTVKLRPLNIALCLGSIAVLVLVFLPDALSF